MSLIRICPKCYITLFEAGEMVVEVYKLICKYYLDVDTGCYFPYEGKMWPIICYLENKGYVLTADYDDNLIAVKPLGHKISDYDDYPNSNHHIFCLCTGVK